VDVDSYVHDGVDDHGEWTQIFGGKAFQLETSKPIKKCNFYLPTGFLSFVEIFCIMKLESDRAALFT